MALGTQGPDLKVQDRQAGTDILVQRKLSFQSHSTLGHLKAPAGNQSAQLTKLTRIGVNLARQLYTSSATRSQALIFYWSIYLPSIRYALPQSFFSSRHLHDAQAKSFPLILAKTGFMHTMSYKVVFGPTHLGGAGFVRWSTLQGEGQILLFLKHWRARDAAGHLLRVALAWAQYQAGTSKPILQDTKSRLSYLESRWIPSLRRFLGCIGATIITDELYIAPRQRENDEYIMDVVITLDELSDKELHILNCCRLYLNVITVSDLVDSTDNFLDMNIQLHEPSSTSRSTYHIPVQTKPSNWKLWDIVLSRWFHDDGRLRRPLGRWLYPAPRLRREWTYYFDSVDGQIYRRVVDGFVRYAPVSTGFAPQEVASWEPTVHTFPVSVSPQSNGSLRRVARDFKLPIPPSTPSIAHFSQFVTTLPAWQQPLLTEVDFQLPPYQFLSRLESLQTPTSGSGTGALKSLDLTVVSDGSQRQHKMSFGWTFAFSDGSRIATCSGPGYGPGTSHQAEGYGVLSAALFVTCLRSFLGIQSPWHVTFVSDNKGLITRLKQRLTYATNYPNSTLAPDWDLVESITEVLHQSSVRPRYQHVIGHQDETVAYAQLSLKAQLNVDADRLAGEYNVDFTSHNCLVPLVPSAGAHLNIGERTITSRYTRHIRTAAATPDYLEFLIAKNAWAPATWDRIDQTILRRVIARHSSRYVNVVKLMHDYLPTSMIHSYSDPTIDTYCELCHAPAATFQHVLRCPHPLCHAWRRSFLTAIRTHCEQSTTRLGLLQIVTDALACWFEGTNLDPGNYPSVFHRAIREQQEIGWYGFIRGLCTSRWAQIQHAHLQHNGLATQSNTGTHWLVLLVSTMWHHLFELWDSYRTLLHGHDVKTAQHNALRKIRTHIRMLHIQARHIRAADQQWLIPNLEQYLAQAPLATLQRWCSTYEPVLLDAIRLTRDESVANTRPLRAYFPTIHAPRRLLDRAARPHRFQPSVLDASSQSRQRQKTPRPKGTPSSVRRYFAPTSTASGKCL